MDNPLERLEMVSYAFSEFILLYGEPERFGANPQDVSGLLFLFNYHLVDLPEQMTRFIDEKKREAAADDTKPLSLADAGISAEPASSWEDLGLSSKSEHSK